MLLVGGGVGAKDGGGGSGREDKAVDLDKGEPGAGGNDLSAGGGDRGAGGSVGSSGGVQSCNMARASFSDRSSSVRCVRAEDSELM